MTVSGRNVATTLILLFVAALLLLFLGQVTEVAILLFIAALLSVYFAAITDFLMYRVALPRWLALTIAVLGTLAGVVGIGILVLPPVVNQFQELVSRLPGFAQALEQKVAELAERYPILQGTAFGSERGGLVEGMITDASSFVRGSAVPYLTTGGKMAVELFSVLAMAIYMARNPSMYRDGVMSLVPPKHRQLARTITADMRDTLQTWIWAQLFAMLVLAVLTGMGLWLLRVPYALAFGVFTGAVAIVPFFGTIISTVLPALLMLTISGWVHATAVLGLGIVVHLVEANVVAPLIFEERVSLPPVLTILSVLVMASLLGVFGLLVAVPTLAAIMVLTRHILFGQVYGEFDLRRSTKAVLVGMTGERKIVVVPES
jgi:predicted PurR-regulated permease PerM